MKYPNPNKQMLRFATLLGLALSANQIANAQTATLLVQPVIVTVPVGSTSSNGAPFTATLAGVVNPVVLSVNGLPVGTETNLSANGFVATTSGVLSIYSTNIPSGASPFTVTADGGATNTVALTFQSAHIWTGATFTNGGSADFSLPGNWLNGSVPTAASDVVLYDSSGQGSGVLTTNILVSGNTEIASLRSAVTGGGTRRHNIQINNGVKLEVTGTNGLSVLRDRSDTTQEFQLAFTGQEGTLKVVNPNAKIITVNQANQNGRLLLDGLGLFVADVNRIGLADQRSFPNWFSLSTNGYTANALPQQGPGGHNYLARTNVIMCNLPADPNDWNHPAIREYSMVVGRNETGGSTQRNPFRLGISNVFMMNSFCYSAGASPGLDGNGAMLFNPSFTASNPIAIFRGAGGMNDRMAMFAMSDGAAVGASSSAAKSVVNFTSGTVDMLVDRLYMSRNRTNSSGSTPSASPSAALTMNAGIIDANHVILGYQDQGNNQNATGANFCQATLTVNGGTFRVNGTMELGHTTADAGHTTDAEQSYGRFTVSGTGATLMASNITVGGVTKLSGSRNSSVYNTVTVASGGKLIVTNGLGAVDKTITTLAVNTGTLTLHVDGNRATPYIYTTNLTTTGANVIELATVTGLVSDPQTVKLISYETFGGSFSLVLPSGLYGYLENDTVNKTINAVLTTVAPKLVTWNGNLSGNWDNSTANWQGSQLFVPGDFARFDDSASGTRSVTVVGSQSLGSGGVTVSNAGPAYSFTGGTIAGTSAMTKSGAGLLTIDCNSQLPVSLQAGSVEVTANGAIGSTALSAGTSLNSTGSVNGVTSAGTFNNYGNIPANGAVITGGTFTNHSTVTGAFGVSGNGTVAVNNGTITTAGTTTIAATNVLINNGLIVNASARTTINGLLQGNGTFRDNDGYNTGVDGRLQIAGGATCSPGNGPGSIGLLIVEGRFDTDQNANLLIEVAMDGSSTNHDIVAPDYWGAIRCNIVMTNIGLFPFAAGQSFQIVSNHLGGLNNLNINPNRDFKFVPPSPGLGLLWDGTDVFTNGIARIKAIPSTPTSLTTAMVANTNQMTLSWPAGYIGWELQQQMRQLTNGISVLASDWTKVANSDTNNQVTVTINTNNQAVFYRLAHPTYY